VYFRIERTEPRPEHLTAAPRPSIKASGKPQPPVRRLQPRRGSDGGKANGHAAALGPNGVAIDLHDEDGRDAEFVRY
jgi:hypothetical protein